MSRTIHAAIAFDQNYLNQFYALMASIAENNHNCPLHLHCIATGVNDGTLNTISSWLKTRDIKVSFYSVDAAFAARFVLGSEWTMAVYYRLFFPFLIPEDIERLLYIDTDTLVLNSLARLYEEPLDDFPVGAVYDNYVKTQPLIGITEEGEYFNSGVLLMDIPRWKAQKISEQCFEYLLKYPERILFVDQCALNAVLKNNWKHLPVKYNCLYSYISQQMSSPGKAEFIAGKVILHFTLERPWKFLCKHPYRALYPAYLRKAPDISGSPVTDFEWKKVPAAARIRLMEAYWNYPLLQRMRRALKRR